MFGCDGGERGKVGRGKIRYVLEICLGLGLIGMNWIE